MSKKTTKITEDTPVQIKEETEQEIITARSKRKTPKADAQVIGNLDNGAIGVETKKVATKKAKTDKAPSSKMAKAIQEDDDKVAIYSERNMSWSEVGKVNRGYNIVTKEQAEKWLTRNNVREVDPQELIEKFGYRK